MREIKAWLMQFVARIELGYNRARIFYTYSMIDLFSTGGNLRNTFLHLGGINFLQNQSELQERRGVVAGLRFKQRGKLDMIPINNLKSHN